MARLDDEQYRRLRAFLAYFDEQFFSAMAPGLPAEARPLAALDATERTSRARAAAGLRMAVNDIVEMTLDWPQGQVEAVDRALSEGGIPSLSEVRATFSSKVAAVLRRGRIRGEVEYYLVKGVLDGAAEALSEDDQLRASRMISAYEAAKTS
ncbi:hypothetical protein [Caulobacter sp. 17J65-9]|uniref:hypothetical protein n=1 Tax=Caulobacter sp. 17J65-9 TaxID=2709382 RepID=UPI0013CD0B64|nr:hypothetical protein [Caulobacter sp. 17J65-9]NEX95324.1 hypothetical protein [Caulobacter sp. 17J65-9]